MELETTHTTAAHLTFLIPNVEAIFGEFKAIRALSREQSKFWEYFLHENTICVENLGIYEGNLGTTMS